MTKRLGLRPETRFDSARLLRHALGVSSRVATWLDRDLAHGILPIDREIVASTHSLRALILDLLDIRGDGAADGVSRGPQGSDRDLWSACLVMGRAIAEGGGSATLASCTMESALDVVAASSPCAADWLAPARAALFEGYVAATRELHRHRAEGAWEYPRCAVALGDATIAIAVGFPEGDDEALEAWAARVAHDAALDGVRRAIVADGEHCGPARAALDSALSLAGIRVHDTLPAPSATRRWLPWRASREPAR